MIIDTHAHLFWESFKSDYDFVIDNAVSSGVTKLINVGVDVPTSQISAALNNEKITFYSSIGIHPHEAVNYAENQKQMLEDVKILADIYQANPQKVIAVGECGLDYFYESNPGWVPSSLSTQQVKELQKQLLKLQVNLAKQLNLPLIIHCRDAWNDIFDLVTDHYGVFHCYTGDLKTAEKILQTNFSISFSAIITYPKNDELRKVVKSLPLEKMLVETDCPFLPPQTKRGQRNEPGYITETLQAIADIRNQPKEEIEQAIYQNTQKLFKLTF